MRLDVFNAEEVINFCFMDCKQIDEEIIKTTKDFISYQRNVAKGEAFSESTNKRYIRMLDILQQCKDKQLQFLKDFVDGK